MLESLQTPQCLVALPLTADDVKAISLEERWGRMHFQDPKGPQKSLGGVGGRFVRSHPAVGVRELEPM